MAGSRWYVEEVLSPTGWSPPSRVLPLGPISPMEYSGCVPREKTSSRSGVPDCCGAAGSGLLPRGKHEAKAVCPPQYDTCSVPYVALLCKGTRSYIATAAVLAIRF